MKKKSEKLQIVLCFDGGCVLSKLFMTCFLALMSFSVLADKIAVSDLVYTDKVSGFFRTVDYHSTSNSNFNGGNANTSGQTGSNFSNYNNHNSNSHTDYSETNAFYNYVIYGELRKFVGDIKGEILKSGRFQVTQSKPFVTKGTETIYDVIDRIKKGYFPNADWVLFGTVSDISFTNEINPVIGTNTATASFGLTLTAEFSLVNTKTYETKAAFSAIGEGQDVKMVIPGSLVIPNRTKAIAEVSKSIGKDVAQQLLEQLNLIDTSESEVQSQQKPSVTNIPEGKVFTYRE